MNVKHTVRIAALTASLLPLSAGAQVSNVELDIEGYLCGF